MAYNQGNNPFSKSPLNFNSPLNSFDSLVGKLMNQGKSKEAATKIAGKVANAKMKGAGSGPTAAQKARAKGSAAKMESPAKAHDKQLKALEKRIKRVRQSKEGAEGQGGIDYELLADLMKQKKQLIESHGSKAKETAKPSPANHAGHPGGDPTKDARGNDLQTAVSSVKGEGVEEVKGEDPQVEIKKPAKRLTQADLDAKKSTAKSKGVVSSEGRDGTNRQERKKRRQERRKIRRSKDLSSTQKRMAVKESRQQQKDNVRGVKKESPAAYGDGLKKRIARKQEQVDAAKASFGTDNVDRGFDRKLKSLKRKLKKADKRGINIESYDTRDASGVGITKSPVKMKKKPGGKRNPLTSSPMGDLSGDKVYGPGTAAISVGKKVIKGGKKLIKGAAKLGKKVAKGMKEAHKLAQTGGPYKK